MATAQGIGQGLFVDQAATRGVDQECAWLHQGQLLGADHVAGLLVEWAVQGQRIDLRQQFVQRQAIGARGAAGQLAKQHAHAEGFGQAGDGAAQFAMAEHAQRLAFEFDDGVIEQAELTGLLPTTGSDIALVVGQARGQGQQQHQGVLCHGRGAVALAVAHGYAVVTGGFQVDVVDAGSGYQNQFQLWAGSEGGGVQRHLVADGDLGPLQAFGDLIRTCVRVQGQLGERLMQRLHVEVAKVEGGMVEEDGAWAVAHQLYLFAGGSQE